MEWLKSVGDFLNSLDPMMVVFGVLCLIGFRLAWQAQKREDFDWSQLFKNTDAKVSAASLGSVICLFASTWVVILVSYKSWDQAVYFYTAYLVVWSGQKVAEKLIDAHYGRKEP